MNKKGIFRILDLEFRKINNQFRSKKLMPSALCLVPVILFLCLNLSAGTRIAIVSDNGDQLTDLLTAELSAVEGVELLDRSEIRKVLKEHKISAQMLDSKQALKLNKLLKTDLFVVIESEQKSMKPIGLVVFDANTGVRYWDSALPEGDIDKTAEFAKDAVKKALGKRHKALGGKLKYISLLGVRNADLPRDQDPFCKAVGILLMRKLGNSPDIVVLEREYLNWLNRERNLPGMEWSNELLASNMLLELEVSKEDSENKVNCTLLWPEKQSLKISGNLDNPANLADKLVAKFAEKVKWELSILKPNTKNEARRFFNEYNLLKKHVMRDMASEKISVAYALDPERRDIALEYMRSLAYLADERIDNPKAVDEGLDYMEAAINLSHKLADKPGINELNFESVVTFMAFNNRIDLRLNNLLPISNHGANRSKSRNMTEKQISRIKHIHSKWMKLRKQSFSRHYLPGDTSYIENKQKFNRYTDFVDKYIDTSVILTGEQWIRDCFPEIEKWLDNSSKYYRKTGKELSSVTPLKSLTDFMSCQPEISIENKDEIKRLIGKIEKHPSNYVNAYGILLKLILKLNEGFVKKKLNYISIHQKTCTELQTRLLKDIYPEYVEECKIAINNLPAKLPPRVVMTYYNNMFTPLPWSEYKREIMEKVFDFMLERKEIYETIAFDWVLPISAEKLDNGDFTKRFNKICRIADSDSCRMFPAEKNVQDALKRAKLKYYNKLNTKNTSGASDLPWDNAVKLLDFRGKRNLAWEACSLLSYAFSPCKNYCYITVVGNKHAKDVRFQGNAIYFLKISLKTGSLEILSKYDFGKSENVKRPKGGKESKIYKDCFISPSSNGILIFPLPGNNQSPIRIDKKSGLFAENISSVCVKDNKIYALAGDHTRGFLIDCDMSNNFKVRILDSSMKTQNNENPFLPSGMGLCEIYSSKDKNKIIAQINGVLAKYDFKTGKWKKIISDYKINYSKKYDEKSLMLAGFDFCFIYDLANGSIDHILGKKKSKPRLEFIYSKTIHGPPLAIGEKYFWSGNKFMCRSFKTGKIQELPHPMWSPNKNFTYVRLLEVVDKQKKLLVGTEEGLFLLNLK